ncbi:MAG: adenine phosphoribosyltransferase [bacterium]|jgi:adenine phosphoribosyltransferase|nr:adenine phosphoribosyltransferase [bacterium]
MDLKSTFRIVPDFPKPGIQFVDITTLLLNPKAFQYAMDAMAEPYKGKSIDKVIAVESRGFIFGSPLALQLQAGLVLVRKPHKLPAETFSHTYALEYGQDAIEMHKDAVSPGETVVIVDDLLATGGTVEAAKKLLSNMTCQIEGISFIVELPILGGRKKLEPVPVHSLVTFDFD